MKFSKKSHIKLKSMGINANLYYCDLLSRFPIYVCVVDQLIAHFSDFSEKELTTDAFNQFVEDSSLCRGESAIDTIYDIFNYLRLFKAGGRFGLFKGRQAEWDGPIVELEKSDVPDSDLDSLAGTNEIYRGMSLYEFESDKFGQSWTTNIHVARKFAFDTYIDKPRGIVAKAPLEKNAIFYSLNDSESEVIVEFGSITSVEKIEQ